MDPCIHVQCLVGEVTEHLQYGKGVIVIYCLVNIDTFIVLLSISLRNMGVIFIYLISCNQDVFMNERSLTPNPTLSLSPYLFLFSSYLFLEKRNVSKQHSINLNLIQFRFHRLLLCEKANDRDDEEDWFGFGFSFGHGDRVSYGTPPTIPSIPSPSPPSTAVGIRTFQYQSATKIMAVTSYHQSSSSSANRSSSPTGQIYVFTTDEWGEELHHQ